MLAQCYIGVAIFVSSFLALFVTDFVWTSLGIVTAALWISANLLALAIIKLIGLSVGSGVWYVRKLSFLYCPDYTYKSSRWFIGLLHQVRKSCVPFPVRRLFTAISRPLVIVSFLWGATVFSQYKAIASLPLALLALGILLLGTAGVSLSGTEIPERLNAQYFGGTLAPRSDPKPEQQQPATDSSPSSDASVVALESLEDPDPEAPAAAVAETPRNNYLIGIALCGLLGLCNGSTLVPLFFVAEEARGINFVMSFAIGLLIVTPIFAVPYFWYHKTLPRLLPGEISIYPLAAGLMWNVGNFSSIYATLALGQAIGFTLTQLALVPASMWGILFFKEISGAPKILTFCLSTVVLLIGAFLLGTYG